MLKLLFHKAIQGYEKQFGYDATYLHEVLDASIVAFIKFMLFQTMANHRDGVSTEAWYAAKLAGALSEDCGPCSQLVVDMALKDGVPQQVIAALLRGDMDKAGEDASLGFRYGQAVANRDPSIAALVESVKKRFNERGLVALDFVASSARVYPCLKRGMGHGMACVRLTVGPEEIITQVDADMLALR
jgi:hypothetical protein